MMRIIMTSSINAEFLGRDEIFCVSHNIAIKYIGITIEYNGVVYHIILSVVLGLRL